MRNDNILHNGINVFHQFSTPTNSVFNRQKSPNLIRPFPKLICGVGTIDEKKSMLQTNNPGNFKLCNMIFIYSYF